MTPLRFVILFLPPLWLIGLPDETLAPVLLGGGGRADDDVGICHASTLSGAAPSTSAAPAAAAITPAPGRPTPRPRHGTVVITSHHSRHAPSPIQVPEVRHRDPSFP